MAIIVTCECGKEFQPGDEHAGRRARCLGCGRETILSRRVPAAEAPRVARSDEPERTSGNAIASLILGLMSLLCCANVVTGIPAVVLGILGINDVSSSAGRVRGKGLAIAGILTGCFGSLTVLVFIVVLIQSLKSARSAIDDLVDSAQCKTNLTTLGLAIARFESGNGHFVPPAITDKEGKPLLSWRVAILPCIGAKPLYDRFHLAERWDSPHNKALLTEIPKVYLCRSASRLDPTLTAYQVYVGPGTLFDHRDGVKISSVSKADV